MPAAGRPPGPCETGNRCIRFSSRLRHMTLYGALAVGCSEACILQGIRAPNCPRSVSGTKRKRERPRYPERSGLPISFVLIRPIDRAGYPQHFHRLPATAILPQTSRCLLYSGMVKLTLYNIHLIHRFYVRAGLCPGPSPGSPASLQDRTGTEARILHPIKCVNIHPLLNRPLTDLRPGAIL